MKQPKSVKLGSFTVVSGTLRISDPCYDLNDWCAGDVENCKKGQWNSHVKVYDEGKWGNRVGVLIACHQDYPYDSIADGYWVKEKIDVGVDSGQGGIFDKEFFKKDEVVKGVKRTYKGEAICIDEPWYSICCDKTLGKKRGGVIPFGCVSSSGYGDGSYICRTYKHRGKIVGVMIDYGLAS